MTEFETDVARIVDVLAVRSVPDGDHPEVHVLASPGRVVSEIAADVHSLAVLRGVALQPDDIHIVQLQPTEEAPAEEAPAPPLAAAHASGGRVEVDSVMVVTTEGASRAVATARLGTRVATGTSVFVPATAALRRGVAEATLAALVELAGPGSLGEIAVDNAVLFPLPPHEVAVVTLAVVTGITEQTLVGAVLVGSAGANDAIARAVLDATNRKVAGRPVT